MDVASACQMINESLVFMPGWSWRAEDFTTRHEGTVCLYVEYPGRETARSEAPYGYPEHNRPRAAMLLQVGNLSDQIALFRAVIEKFIAFWTHEARECFRVKPTFWAPFHPHKIDGMERWGDMTNDLYYGFNSMEWSYLD